VETHRDGIHKKCRGRLSRGRPLTARKDPGLCSLLLLADSLPGLLYQGEVKWVDRGGDERRLSKANERWTNWIYNFLENINSFRKLRRKFPE